jgi:hypothetical protein
MICREPAVSKYQKVGLDRRLLKLCTSVPNLRRGPLPPRESMLVGRDTKSGRFSCTYLLCYRRQVDLGTNSARFCYKIERLSTARGSHQWCQHELQYETDDLYPTTALCGILVPMFFTPELQGRNHGPYDYSCSSIGRSKIVYLGSWGRT